MAIYYRDIEKIQDLKALIPSQLDDGMFAYCTDTKEIAVDIYGGGTAYVGSGDQEWSLDTINEKVFEQSKNMKLNLDSSIAIGAELKNWDTLHNIIQVGDLDPNIISIYAEQNDYHFGIINNGAFWNGTNYVNGVSEGYATRLINDINNGFKIEFADSNTASANITWDDGFFLTKNAFAAYNMEEVKINNNGGVSYNIHMDETGITFLGERGNDGLTKYPIEVKNLNYSIAVGGGNIGVSDIRFDEIFFAFAPGHYYEKTADFLEVFYKRSGEIEKTGYILLVSEFEAYT